MKAGMVRRVWRCDLNRSNRPVRTRMPGGVAGERPFGLPPMPILLSGSLVIARLTAKA
jgi:hypothetical protein